MGVETMIADNVSVSGEYSYVGLPDLTAPTAGLGGLGFLGTGGSNTFSGGIHQIKAGVKYHF